MKRDMRRWLDELRLSEKKKALPILSFPSAGLLGVTVRELIADGEMQARGMKAIADAVDSAAAVSLMDLSVEAECFGAEIRVSDDEVPTVIGRLVLHCVKEEKAILDLSLAELKQFSEMFEEDVFEACSMEACVNLRDVPGGPAPARVQASIAAGKTWLEHFSL